MCTYNRIQNRLKDRFLPPFEVAIYNNSVPMHLLIIQGFSRKFFYFYFHIMKDTIIKNLSSKAFQKSKIFLEINSHLFISNYAQTVFEGEMEVSNLIVVIIWMME